VINTNTPGGVWLNLSITNQLDPATFAVIGAVTNLVAPAGAASARYQGVFQQPLTANGAVLFDDLELSPAGTPQMPVRFSVSQAGGNVNLGFPTYLGFTYNVRYQSELTETNWLSLINLLGDRDARILADAASTPRRFYRVSYLCN
jgi:hypothetical protein